MTSDRKSLFESIYLGNRQMVFRLCMGFVRGDRESASDIMQEVFLNVWENLDRFRGESSHKTWIYRIAVNCCLQYVNSAKRSKTLLETAREHLSASDETEEQSERIGILHRAIAQLAPVDRLIIMMVLESQNYDTIARVMGISSENVRVKVHRIKKRLKGIIENDNSHG